MHFGIRDLVALVVASLGLLIGMAVASYGQELPKLSSEDTIRLLQMDRDFQKVNGEARRALQTYQMLNTRLQELSAEFQYFQDSLAEKYDCEGCTVDLSKPTPEFKREESPKPSEDEPKEEVRNEPE